MNAKAREQYQSLDLPYGASAEEVKKAYFRLVRRFNPENEPDKFQEIRAAYEALKDGPPEEDTEQDESWIRWDHPVIGYLVQMADKYADEEKYDKAVDLLKDAALIEPDNPLIHLLMARYLAKDSHFQKAAKEAEIVLRFLPDNPEAWLIVANGYQNRGWHKKALPAFRKSEKLGYHSIDFLLGFGQNLYQNNLLQEAEQKFRQILQNPEMKKSRPDTFLFRCQMIADSAPGTETILELLDLFDEYAQTRLHRKKGEDQMYHPLHTIAFYRQDLMQDPAVLPRFFQSLELSGTLGLIEQNEKQLLLFHLLEGALDNHLEIRSECWSRLLRARLSLFVESEELRRFQELDGKLCLLKDRESLLHDIPVIRRDIAPLTEMFDDFMREAEQEDTSRLYRSLKFKFDKLSSKYYSMFEKLYPEEVPSSKPQRQPLRDPFGSPLSFSEEDKLVFPPEEPFIRGTEKVGRNDPCPCGSGKKFKKCCMGKGIYD